MNKLFVFLMFFLVLSCSENDAPNDNTQDSGFNEQDLTGKFSLFPLAENPDFNTVSEVNLNNGALVGMVNFGSEIRVYPYAFVVHNEIINDEFQGQKYAFSYCPITKSTLAFTREQVFRASGYLYKENLTPWDKKTETIWSQMLVRGLIGNQKNKRFNTIPVVETTWKTVKQYFPNAMVVSSNLFSTKNPLPGNNNNSNSENSPALNDLAYGIIDSSDNVYIFKYADFSDGNGIGITIQSQNYIVYGNSSKRIINAFKVSSITDYDILEDDFPFVLEHSNGTKYDIFGRGTNGSVLEKPKVAYIAIWTAWKDFYSVFYFQD